MDYRPMLYHQLALDLSLSPEDFPLRENRFTKKAYLPGRRIYKADRGLLSVISIDSRCVFSSTDDRLLAWCREQFGETDGAWICEMEKLTRLDRKLRSLGHYIADAHPFFIPKHLIDPHPVWEVRWYEQGELEVFRGDPRFPNVLGDRDMLVAAAFVEGRLAGAAGASADSPDTWQIGIDVLPEFRGRGLARDLTALLAREVERRGHLPFYGTGASHIRSQQVAIAAGFVPAWWELYTKAL